MEDSLKTIAMITVLVNIHSSVYKDGYTVPEQSDAAHDNLRSEAKKLSFNFSQAASDNDCQSMSEFYERFGNLISECKGREQVAFIFESFLDAAFDLESLIDSAPFFTDIRMSAIQSGDFGSVDDINAAFLYIVSKYRTIKGDSAADRLIRKYDYSYAGASLGYEMSMACSQHNETLKRAIAQRAESFTCGNLEDELIQIFRTFYTKYAGL